MTDTKETEKYFRDLNEMFSSNGWKHLINDLQLNVNQINSVELTKDANDLMFRKGQLVVIANILNLPATIEQAQSDFENDDSEAA